MKLTLLGSGGAFRIPRACCTCTTCEEAREKGVPYKRLGQSLFLHGEDILFDTPEDINEALNTQRISAVKAIVYSHWHPDHTLGGRIIEVLRDSRQHPPIDIHMPSEGIELTFNHTNDVFSFYEYLGYCQIKATDEPILLSTVTIHKIQLLNGFAYAYLLVEGDKRVLYCPCHSMHLPLLESLREVDLLIMGLGSIPYELEEETSFQRDNLRIIEALQPKQVVFTHIEECNGMGYDAYQEMERDFPNIRFGYDGMILQI